LYTYSYSGSPFTKETDFSGEGTEKGKRGQHVSEIKD
jgi:hypothetical protein